MKVKYKRRPEGAVERGGGGGGESWGRERKSEGGVKGEGKKERNREQKQARKKTFTQLNAKKKYNSCKINKRSEVLSNSAKR